MSRVVITTAGSLGDLFPFVAIAIELRRRGHDVVVGTSPCYQQRIASLGLDFHGVRPDSNWLADEDMVRRLSHPRWGLIRVGRQWLLPALRHSYADTMAAAQGADLLVTMLANYATRLVAEKQSIPWVSAVHIPMAFFSAVDPPLLDISPLVSKRLRFLGRGFWGPLFWCGKRASRFLANPWYQLRSELGLPPTSEGNPLADSHSPMLVLALFSRLLADKQPDWPAQTVITGFPFHDDDARDGLQPSLERFLNDGPPPIVFTLGSAVSGSPGSFYGASIGCAKRLQRRAVLVVGRGSMHHLPRLPTDMIAVEYAPFSRLFPRSLAVVHHGGVGTTALAMRSGRPMLVVPNAWDQPDNAERCVRLGIARTVSKKRYTPQRAARELSRLLDDRACAQRARDVGKQVQRENGAVAACDALEELLR